MKKIKRKTLPQLKKELWKLVSEYVKKRDSLVNNGFCLSCGMEPIYSANHIIPKSESFATAFELDNVYGGCEGCNYSEFKRRSHWARVKFPQIFGAEKIATLTLKSLTKIDNPRIYLLDKIEEVNKLLEKI